MNNKLSYEDLEKKVKEQEVIIHNLKEENKDLQWYKFEYKSVEKLKGKIMTLQSVIKELISAV